MKTQIFAFAALVLSVFTQPLLANSDFSLEKYKGKGVYVDFSASRCAPCRESFPFMQNLVKTYGDRLVIAAINVDKNRSDANRFLAQFDITFDIIYDPDGTLAKSFGIKDMPSSFVYDQQGSLISAHVGFNKKDMEEIKIAVARAINGEPQ